MKQKNILFMVIVTAFFIVNARKIDSQQWQSIQRNAKNTVVQVFSQVIKINLLQPYKAPEEYSCTGSGFFINNEGYFITNAHVINSSTMIWIQIPGLGKQYINTELISICPDRDFALLRVCEKDLIILREILGEIPYLTLGDSDAAYRSDRVLTLGYPLGQETLKSTTGVISGQEGDMIQISAPINPGSSGGPLLNNKGEVIGICTSVIDGPRIQNVNYIIPINELKLVLDDMYSTSFLRVPLLGLLYNNANKTLTSALGNPQPGGCFVSAVVYNSALDKAGVQPKDMIYSINSHTIDIYGELSVPWSEDKISIIDYIRRLNTHDPINFVLYRSGKKIEKKVWLLDGELPIIGRIYSGYEAIDYEIFGGMVVMELTKNHINLLSKKAPWLSQFLSYKHQKPILVITHIFNSSILAQSRTIGIGSTLNLINDQPVHTLNDFRQAIKKCVQSPYIAFTTSDMVHGCSDNIKIAFETQLLIEQENLLSKLHGYVISDLLKLFDHTVIDA